MLAGGAGPGRGGFRAQSPALSLGQGRGSPSLPLSGVVLGTVRNTPPRGQGGQGGGLSLQAGSHPSLPESPHELSGWPWGGWASFPPRGSSLCYEVDELCSALNPTVLNSNGKCTKGPSNPDCPTQGLCHREKAGLCGESFLGERPQHSGPLCPLPLRCLVLVQGGSGVPGPGS